MTQNIIITVCLISMVFTKLSYQDEVRDKLKTAKRSIFWDVDNQFEPLRTGDIITLDAKFRQSGVVQIRVMCNPTSCSGGTSRGSSSSTPQCQSLVLRFYIRNHTLNTYYKGEPNNFRDVFLHSYSNSKISSNEDYQLEIEVGEDDYTIRLNGDEVTTVSDKFGYENVVKLRFYGGGFYSLNITQRPEYTIEVHSAGASCGVRPGLVDISSRIVSGQNAKPGEIPWQAAIRRKYTTVFNTHKHQCGAALINSRWVITAAHCASFLQETKHQYIIRLGDLYNKDDNTDHTSEEDQQDFDIKRVVIHHHYEANPSPVNDIALFELNSSASFSNFVRPICLPDRNERFRDGSSCIISGWGARSVSDRLQDFPAKLQVANVEITNIDQCKESYGFESDGTKYRVANNTICAAGQTQDSCQGDSGGPLACMNQMDTFVLWGVISWGDGCGDKMKPGIYTKVADYLNWIYQTIG